MIPLGARLGHPRWRRALAAAWWSLTAGDTESISHWASLAEHGGDAILPDGTPLRSAVLLLRSLAGGEGLTDVREHAALAFELDRPESVFRPIACFVEGGALRLLGEPRLARERLEDGSRLAGVLHPATHVHCLTQLALLDIEEGALSEGASRVDRALQRFAPPARHRRQAPAGRRERPSRTMPLRPAAPGPGNSGCRSAPAVRWPGAATTPRDARGWR